MKLTKRIMSILLACLMLTGMLSVGVFAAGTQDDPIDANAKWFGYGVDCYLLNPTLTEANADGLWYTLTVEQDGLLFVEHSYKNVDYTVTVTVNGVDYVGGYVDGVLYNAPLVTLPVATGDVATICVEAAAGTVYANAKIIAGDEADPVKVKSSGIDVYVGAGETVYYQDDSLNAIYATSGMLVEGDAADTTFYKVNRNSESGTVSTVAVTDTDGDGVIETVLGGSLGSAGAPPVKPAWAIENNSAEDRVYTLTLADNTTHECVYDDAADTDCNTCGAVREQAHQHEYDHDYDRDCNTCGEQRKVVLPLQITGSSISPDVNGLAWLVQSDVKGITLKNGCEIDYTNATVGNYKLLKMGAVATNSYYEFGYVPNLDDVDGYKVLNIEAKYVYALNEDGTLTYAIRIVDIPEEYKDREIDILTYVIFEDEAGQVHTLYCNSVYAAYNWFV